MALQLRRGTDAERLTITPAEGELIYTTDTKLIYVGDGSTLGGTKADSGITDLLSDTSPQLGGNLDLNSQTITGTGAINITGNINGNTVAGSSGNFTSSVIGSLSAASIQGDLTGSVFADDSTMLVDGTDGKIVLVNNVIQDLSNVYVPVTPTAGDALIWNAVDSRWEAGNPAASGGAFVGDVKGSIFADDSTLVFDAINNGIRTPNASLQVVAPIDFNEGISFGGVNNQINIINFQSFNNRNQVNMLRTTNEDIQGEYVKVGDTHEFQNGTARSFGALTYQKYDGVTIETFGVIEGFSDGILIGHETTPFATLPSKNKRFTARDGFFTFGDVDLRERVNVGGSIYVSGEVTADQGIRANIVGDDSAVILNYSTGAINASTVTGDLKGSVFADDSTAIVDSINQTITAGGFVQFGSYNTTERNALTAANGMVIYNSQVNRFQGYQNGAWINIDDGTAA
jgi:hypothetical protein